MSLKLLAVAATSRRVGHVFLIGRRVERTEMAVKPMQSTVEAAGWLQKRINKFEPDVVATENIPKTSRKGQLARTLTDSFQRTAAENCVLDIPVERKRAFTNKYEEAAFLADAFPDVRHLLPPKRRYFDPEPHSMVLFDALAIAYAVLQRPTLTMAEAMR